VANKIWYIENQQIKEYPGTYQEYEEWQTKRPAGSERQPKAGPAVKGSQPSRKEQDKPAIAHQKSNSDRELSKLNKELETAEAQINELKEKIAATEQRLSDP